MIRLLGATFLIVMLLAPGARAQSPEISPEQWKSVAKAVRIVKRDYVTPVEDARLVAACSDRLYALPSLRTARPAQPVSALTDIPVVLRSAAGVATDVVPAQLIAECVNGMLSSLDAHSRYVPPDEASELRLGLGSVGLELTIYNNTVLVVETLEGSPAA